MRTRALVAAYLTVAVVTAPLSILATRALLPTRAAAAPPPANASSARAPAVAAQLRMMSQPTPPGPVIGIPANPAAVKGPGYASYVGWALLDRHTGTMTGSTNRETGSNTTESMIKVWIAADYLRHQTGQPPAAAVNELYQMIIHSDDNIAHRYYVVNGGDDSISELITVCGLRGTHRPMIANSWSYTTMSAADAVRMGACIGGGKVLNPTWTAWLLKAMHNVQGGVADQQAHTGGGRWGIIDALPAPVAANVSIKNGWTAQMYDHNWHVNCLAVHPDWVLAIQVRYPWTSPNGDWHSATNLQQGADACRTVTKQLLVTPDG